jgi:hypothetical protein
MCKELPVNLSLSFWGPATFQVFAEFCGLFVPFPFTVELKRKKESF